MSNESFDFPVRQRRGVFQRGCNEKAVIDTLEKVLKINSEEFHF